MVNVIFLSFVYLQFNAFGGFHKVCKVNVLWSTTEFFYAHDSHHVIKGNVDLSYEDTENMNIKKGKLSHSHCSIFKLPNS